jgi:hypothetical protein
LRRSLLVASAIVFSAIVLVEGAALVGLDRLDGMLSEMQSESVAESRRMLELGASTSNLSLAARRFRDIGDREDLSQAEMALREELRNFSTLAESLPALKGAEATPPVVPALVQASKRLSAIVTDLAATVAEAIDAAPGCAPPPRIWRSSRAFFSPTTAAIRRSPSPCRWRARPSPRPKVPRWRASRPPS